MKIYLFRVYLFFLILPTFMSVVAGESNDEAVEVSLVRLIAAPGDFNGKRIIVTGFLYIGDEVAALYLTRDDARIGNRPSSVAIGTYKKGIVFPNHSFVRIVGTFHVEPSGHMGLWKSGIRDITSATNVRSRTLHE